jgi:hypothetical protein
MLKMIEQIKNPDEKDVNYLQGVMKGKKYNRKNRTELTAKLVEMEAALKPKSAVTFVKTQTAKEKAASGVVDKAKDLAKGKAPDLMSDRAVMFKDMREKLLALAEESTEYARKQSGGASLRLNNVATNLTRLAKKTLRE